MKPIWNEIKEQCRTNRTELLLMLLFLLLFAVVMGPDIAKEVSSGSVQTSISDVDADNRNNKNFAGKDSGISDADADPKNNKNSAGKDSSISNATADKKNGENNTNNENDKDSGEEDTSTPDTDQEPETTYAEHIAQETSLRRTYLRHLRSLQAQYGRDFIIPMAIPKQAELVLPTLQSSRRLEKYSRLLQPQTNRTLDVLGEILAQQLAQYDGDWSVYVKNLDTEEELTLNDRPMKSASVMKLFIMGTVYQAYETGMLEENEENQSLVEQMITLSDNAASNELLYRLGGGSYASGIAEVDAFIQAHGFSDMTVEYNGFNDPATNTGTGNYNQVSAKDCGKLLEDIYRRSWVNREVSNEMEALLLAQHTRYKIPAGLPDGVLCGNKTGEMDATENDAAIIYAPDCDYILVVLSSDWNSKSEAIDRISSISKITYHYLNA